MTVRLLRQFPGDANYPTGLEANRLYTGPQEEFLILNGAADRQLELSPDFPAYYGSTPQPVYSTTRKKNAFATDDRWGFERGVLPELSRVATHIGQVATACLIPNASSTTQKQANSRSPHWARDTITALQIVLPGWWVSNVATATNTEQGIGSDTTYTASVEYPAGTFTQVTFTGSTSGIAPDGGELVSDMVSVSIPKGQRFWVRLFVQNATRIVFTGGGLDVENGAQLAYAPSGLSDQTMSGTINNSGAPTISNGNIITPLAIIATTTMDSLAVIEDSRGQGVGDSYVGISGDRGNLGRSVGAFAPYINLGISSERLMWAITTATKRISLATRYASRVIVAMGINDITAGRTNAQIAADEQTLRGLIPMSIPVHICTIEPNTTSTDSWATTANQTPFAQDAVRVSVNNRRRNGVANFASTLDLADGVESGRDSGKWDTQYGAPTADGLHANRQGYMNIVNNRVVTPAKINGVAF
jgi:lysophospholipase L1-like esterase